MDVKRELPIFSQLFNQSKLADSSEDIAHDKFRGIVRSIIKKLQNDLEQPPYVFDLSTRYSSHTTHPILYDCDFFIALNIFCPFCKVHGLEKIHQLANEAAKKAIVCLFKVPSPNESIYRSSTGFKDPYELFSEFHYVEQLSGDSGDVTTTIYFCSNSYWYANGEIEAFDSWTEISHDSPWIKKTDTTHAQTRRYYFSKNKMLKHYRFKNQKSAYNKEEMNDEINFLTQYHSLISYLPRIIKSQINHYEGWLLREKVNGVSLTKIINQGINYDAWKIIKSVLEQLTLLESQGLYHTDLRTWNILLSENGEVALIDYGAIKPTMQDIRHRKKHVFFSFLVFVYEVVHREIIRNRDFNPIFINIVHYPKEFHSWMQHLLCTHFSQWSFRRLLILLTYQTPIKAEFLVVWYILQNWLEKTEHRLLRPLFKIKYFHKRFIKHFERHFVRKINKELKK